jgi:hypothetical protein
MIGRPNGYTDGAILHDSRAEPYELPGVDEGALLEVWPDESAATARSKELQTAKTGGNGILRTEYHYQHGGYLLRVTSKLKPSEAKAYETAFNAQF